MIYISLTTVPDRLNNQESAERNLISLLTQNTDKEYKVLYNVPDYYTGKLADNIGRLPNQSEVGDSITIPEWVYDLQKKYSHLVIKRGKDYGPPTKIVGALTETKNPDDILIILDDDNLYHPDMIEYHVKKLKEYPNAAIGFRGDRLFEKREWIDEEGKQCYCFYSVPDLYPIFSDKNMMITGHWHSVGYKRSFFGDDFLEEDFLFNNHWSDDILVGYYAVKHKKDIKCVAWDKETDWRLINYHGRDCNTFPVLESLPFEESGCHELRHVTGVRVNDQQTYPESWVNEMVEYYKTQVHTNG